MHLFEHLNMTLIAKNLIKTINFRVFYDENEAFYGPPVKFENISDFEKYLFENIDSDTIECLEACKFEIKDQYED